MKKILACTLACGVLLAGCGQKPDDRVATLEGEVKALTVELEQEQARNETLQDQVTKLDGDLRDSRGDADELALKVSKLSSKNEELVDEIDALKTKLESAEARTTTPTPEEPSVSEPTVETPEKTPEDTPETTPPAPDPKVKQRLTDLLPLVKTGTDREALNEAVELIYGSDKQTRDDFITEIQTWVKNEPNNKYARLTLARALTTRFQDLEGKFMKQGELAGQIRTETEKALETDPDYYEAVHFLAILEVNYPAFTPEFKGADKDLDKALELQKTLTWEDHFADIYTAYAQWHRKQGQLDAAAAKVQAGLDHAPRNQGLLDEQKRIEDASNETEGN